MIELARSHLWRDRLTGCLCSFVICATLLGGIASPASAFPDSDRQTEAAADGVNDAAATNPRYSRRRIHDPNGIGKFYFGREIAHVMGFGFRGRGAAWLERETREQEEKLSLLIKSLKLKPGDVVADIGAGSGVISVLMAREVGTDGLILAVDVQQEMLDRLESNVEALGITNIKPIKGTAKSPTLEPGSVDLAIMVDVYHELEFPYEMMIDISKALKPGGRVAFVEYRMEDPTVPIKLVHKMSEDQVKKEMGQPEMALKWKETIGALPRQHIVVFEKQAPSESAPNE